MSAAEIFFDTNIPLYLLSREPSKANRAENLLADGGIVSVQVLNEFAAVARRKLSMSWSEIGEVLTIVRDVCEVKPLLLETHERGLVIGERYGFSLYDSMIVAAAAMAGCSILYSEDMQHGQKIENLTICNPFR